MREQEQVEDLEKVEPFDEEDQGELLSKTTERLSQVEQELFSAKEQLTKEFDLQRRNPEQQSRVFRLAQEKDELVEKIEQLQAKIKNSKN